ncbi:MAG: tetratricopeptide repeat protein [Planctomycetota bacterium]|nr:MAG: tetratricopeptide repeat protein [Planctomycetota bacterium]
MVEPDQGLPENVHSIAIMPASVGPTTDPKWSDLASGILMSLVNESRNRFGTNIDVTDRRDTQVTFDEADLAAAGMSTRPGGSGGQLLAADAAILSNINVKVEKYQGRQRTLSGLNIAGWGGHHWGGGWADIETSEVETVTRSMTVQTEFKLVDARNNRVIAHYSPKPYHGTDRTKASPIFGSSKTEAELTPEDEIVAELVERAAREFVSTLMPCRIDVDVTVVSSRNKHCIQGVRLLRGELYEEALSQFKLAIAENDRDHRALFGAGVACEVLGRYDEAYRYYRRACVEQEAPRYVEARDRMKLYAHRIRR